MLRIPRAASLLALALTVGAALNTSATARPAYLDDRVPGERDPRNALWEPKQAAFERLQEALSQPMDAARASQDDYDVHYYDLDIGIDDAAESVAGTVTMRATSAVDGLTTVVIDLYSNMVIDSIEHDGVPASYSRNSHVVSVALNAPVNSNDAFELVIAYHGIPIDDALDFSTHGIGNPIISSLSEPSGARQWWPCKDAPADKADSARIAITVDETLTAVSNGTLYSVADNGSTRTYVWIEGHPITTYLISVAISNYSHWTNYYLHAGNFMPIENYVYPEHLANAQEDLSITPDAIAVFAGLYGEYPFVDEKYGHAVFPWGGGMEHQTCTSYGRALIRGDHYYDWILVHELSHQWWGDWVTCETWEDIWLNEGFASYSEALWFESLGGEAEYDDYIDSFDNYGYFDGPIYDPDATFNRTVYDKGALVLHMLRRILELPNGTRSHYPIDALQGVLAAYGPANAYSTATTAEFQSYCEAAYGSSMDWFFLPWVYGENRPDYEWSWVGSIEGPPYGVMLHVDQVQTNAGLFTMPIDVEVHTTSSDTLVTVWNDQWSQDFFFDVGALPVSVEFDPGNWVLKHVSQVSTEVPTGATAVALHVPANPARSGARMSYTVPADGRVSLRLYDVAGRLVATLVDGAVTAGLHSAVWDGKGASGAAAASGVYFCRLETEQGADARKLVLVR